MCVSVYVCVCTLRFAPGAALSAKRGANRQHAEGVDVFYQEGVDWGPPRGYGSTHIDTETKSDATVGAKVWFEHDQTVGSLPVSEYAVRVRTFAASHHTTSHHTTHIHTSLHTRSYHTTPHHTTPTERT